MILPRPDKELLKAVFQKAYQALESDLSRAANIFDNDKFTEASEKKRQFERLEELIEYELERS